MTLRIALWLSLLTETLVWLALYIEYCRTRKRLPFARLRVKCFLWLLRHSSTVKWRCRWVTVFFGQPFLAIDRHCTKQEMAAATQAAVKAATHPFAAAVYSEEEEIARRQREEEHQRQQAEQEGAL